MLNLKKCIACKKKHELAIEKNCDIVKHMLRVTSWKLKSMS